MRETRRLKLIIYFHNCLRVMEKYSMTFLCVYVRWNQVKRVIRQEKRSLRKSLSGIVVFLLLLRRCKASGGSLGRTFRC